MTSWLSRFHPVSENGATSARVSWSAGRFKTKMVPYTDGEIRITPARLMQVNTRLTPSLGTLELAEDRAGVALDMQCVLGARLAF
jgi:hypothetical protein